VSGHASPGIVLPAGAAPSNLSRRRQRGRATRIAPPCQCFNRAYAFGSMPSASAIALRRSSWPSPPSEFAHPTSSVDARKMSSRDGKRNLRAIHP
jgi:hypothetical protein